VPALDVRQFVGEGLHRLRVGDVRADPHAAGGWVGEAVGLPAGLAGEHVAVRGDLRGQRLPQGGGGVTGEQFGCDVGQRVALGLGDVEDVRDPKPAQHPGPGRPVGVPAGRLPRRPRRRRGGGCRLAGVGALGGVGARRQDREPGGALDHTAAQRLPGAETGDPGRADAERRGLQRDQQLIVEAVGVELRGRIQHRRHCGSAVSCSTCSPICSCRAAIFAARAASTASRCAGLSCDRRVRLPPLPVPLAALLRVLLVLVLVLVI
jgi:hypothetical protein